MGIFEDAYRQGLTALDSTRAARREIAAVFDDLAQQVSRASDDLLRISWGPPAPAAEDPAGTMSFRAGVFASIGHWGQRRGIGYCSLTSYGYPVKLEYAGVETTCADRDALIEGLAALLRHPDTAAVLRWLIENQQRE